MQRFQVRLFISVSRARFQPSMTTLRPPRITEDPSDVIVRRHEPTTLNCKAEGNPTPTIEWYKDGEKVRNTGNRMMLPSGSLFFLHVIHNKRDADTGVYWCVARNEVGKARSRNASLAIACKCYNLCCPLGRNALSSRRVTLSETANQKRNAKSTENHFQSSERNIRCLIDFREEFKTIPKSGSVVAGELATLECTPPRGHPEPVISWKKDGKLINVGGASRMKIVNNRNLKISDVRPSDKGRYICVAENIVAIRESPQALLNVFVKPYFVKTPEDVTALADETIEFACRAKGEPNPTITWTKKDGKIPVGRTEIKNDKSLRIRHVTVADEGLYTCEAENQGGISIASATLVVHCKSDCILINDYEPKFTARPQFLVSPENANVPINGEAKLDCVTTGNPHPSVFWSKEGNQILMFPGKSYGRFSVTEQGTLVIIGVEKEDQGYYFCSAISIIGSSIGKAYLTVIGLSTLPPPIIRLGPMNQTLPEDGVLMMPCEVSTTTPALVKWLFNEKEIPAYEPRYVVLDSGTLQIDGVKMSDSGVYTCIARNENGESDWSATVTVKSPFDTKAVFHKTPDPFDFPSSPSKPVAVNVTETSITLWWTRNEKSRNIIGFTVEYYSSELTSRWTVAGRRITSEKFTVLNLRPQTSYVFIVRAENEKVLGYPSMPSDEIYTLTPSSYLSDPEVNEARHALNLCSVSLRDVRVLNSTSVRLLWDVKGDAQFVEGFHIRFRDLRNGYHQNYDIASVRKNSVTSYVLTGLKPYKQYEYFLVPFYKSVQGTPSNLKSVQTMEDKPSAFPDNLQVKVTNSSSAEISWSPLSPQQANGVLKGYVLKIESKSSSYKLEVNVSATSSMFALTNLTEGSMYDVRIAAFTAIGFGPITPAVPLKMDPGYSYSYKSKGDTHANVIKSETLHNIAKEPLFIFCAVVLMFVLSSIILVIVARRHLGWKKSVGAYITVQLNKCEEVEKCGLNATANKCSWLSENFKAANGRENKTYADNNVNKPFCNHNSIRNYGINSEPVYYAEVEGHNLVNFGTLESASTEPYATTTLMNTYHHRNTSNGLLNSEPLKCKFSREQQYTDNSSDRLLLRETQETYSQDVRSDSGSDVYGISMNKFNQSKRFHPSVSSSSYEDSSQQYESIPQCFDEVFNRFIIKRTQFVK
ncbi:roundabout 1-like protein [Leptotrombidium deliense]|uniref:Roundabout 1-like protein n=1 Tax=Leptotrombidium deliense TaxID=299467 RepID=A0A443SVV0_9ACAR|nr:roundabout 1-like protein [Leptotrombidium deliense]